jgi:uncharacterized protein (TIGR02217 family)
MAFRESPRFPDAVAFGATGGPQWATPVVTTFGQGEQRNQRWAMPLYAYEVDLEHKASTEVLAFLAFFATIAQGEMHGFRYHDVNPGEDTGTNELIGTGDGSRTSFQLVKNYTYEAATFSRTITKPIGGTVAIALDGSPTAAFTVDTTTGLVTMASAPGGGVLVRASYQFDVPVQLRIPSMELVHVADNILTWPNIRLEETRVLA